MFEQIFNMVDIGLVVLDREMRVLHWNRWMEQHSGMPASEMAGVPLQGRFPALDAPGFRRNFNSVLKFGNFCFFSQKLHGHLFPFKAKGCFEKKYEFMQQSCTMGPLREGGEIAGVFISVQDVTEAVASERKILEMNMRDGLTGVYNRRFLEARLAEEFNRHRRYSRPMSLIMADIDLFKGINDRHGHQCGDKVIKAVADSLTASTRNTDFIIRYGGEEFCCLLPETDCADAVMLAERLREAIEKGMVVHNGAVVRFTISLGVAGNSGAGSPEAMLQGADAALYGAKNAGRNRVMAVHPDRKKAV